MSISGGHIESDISNIDIFFYKYRYRIEADEKVSIFRYVKKRTKRKKKPTKTHENTKKKGAVKI